jgi:peptidyl-prolyl cis-trans isomerase D
MLSFFRRALSSWFVLAFLGLMLLALVVTGVGTPGSLGDVGSASNGERLAKVGKEAVGSLDVAQRLNIQLDGLRQQQPGASMDELVRQGAVELVLNGLIDTRATQAFAESQGIVVSERLIDAEIAGIDAFKGATGQFDRARFNAILDQRNITERQLRADIARDIIARMVRGPAGASARVPSGVVAPFASLLLEGRTGSVAVVPSAAMGVGAMPTLQELSAFYTRNTAAYTVPERRVIRYAVFDRSRFEGKVTPSEADIEAYYKKNADKYGARETRSITQIIIADQASANAVAAKIKSGTDVNAAAKSVGVEALKLVDQQKAAFSGVSSSAVADAVFTAGESALVGPVKSGLGWHIVRVDSINRTAAKPVSAVRGEILAVLGKDKVTEALSNFVADIENAVADGQNFDDVVKAQALSVVTTPPVTASGLAPDNDAFKPAAELTPLLKDAFQEEPDDDPVTLTIGPDRFAFMDLDRVIPAAPRPLAQITPIVTRKIADTIAAKANAGTPIAAAIAAAGKPLPAPQPIGAKRIDLVAQEGKRIPPPLALLFSMLQRKAKVLEAPDKQGWFVVWLDKIEPGNITSRPDLIAATQSQLSQVVSSEYAEQFTSSIRTRLNVSRDKAATERLKRSLTGSSAQ